MTSLNKTISMKIDEIKTFAIDFSKSTSLISIVKNFNKSIVTNIEICDKIDIDNKILIINVSILTTTTTTYVTTQTSMNFLNHSFLWINLNFLTTNYLTFSSSISMWKSFEKMNFKYFIETKVFKYHDR